MTQHYHLHLISPYARGISSLCVYVELNLVESGQSALNGKEEPTNIEEYQIRTLAPTTGFPEEVVVDTYPIILMTTGVPRR